MTKNFVEELKWRGMLAQMMPGTEELLEKQMVSAYLGTDPTADSLHIGHLCGIMMLRHLQRCGHKPYLLLGGATGMIGDPSGKSLERNLLDSETLYHNQEAIKQQVSKFLDFEGNEPNKAELVNNYDWMKDFKFLDFAREVGKHITVNYMMAKDSVKKRLNGEANDGLSFTEFTYQLLQGYDFLYLYQKHGIKLQLGGNDQWGNMVGGVDLIRKVEGVDTHVMTTPIITKADGTKFGKSEGGAIWLDPELMTPYAFYQFWLQVADDDVVRFLKIFTFKSREEIEALAVEVAERPHQRAAQKALAASVTELVHGADQLQRVLAATDALWGGGDIRDLDEATLVAATADLPRASLTIGESTVADALVALGFEKGKTAARRTISSGGASINNVKVEDPEAVLREEDVLAGGLALIRKGRKNLAVLELS